MTHRSHGKRFGVLSRLSKDERGAISITFGLMLIILVLIVGGVIDFGMALIARSRMGGATDAAAVGAATAPSTTNSTQVAQRYFAANYDTTSGVAVSASDLGITPGNGDVTVKATKVMKTNFLKSGSSVQQIPVNAISTVASGSVAPDVDMVMVLDFSGSMQETPDGYYTANPANTKFAALKQSALDVANILMTPEYANVRLGFSPFSTTVLPKNALTSSLLAATANITGFVSTTGATCGQCGLVGGELLLSSNPSPATARNDGKPYSATKYVVFMTDGEQNIICNAGDPSCSSWSYPPGTYTGYYNSYAGAAVVSECNKLKNIYNADIFTVGFGVEAVNNVANVNDLKNCASNDSHGNPQFYYAPTAASLKTVFQQIAAQAASVRITK